MPKSSGSPPPPPRRCNHFFKIFLPDLSSKRLKIPPAFQLHVEDEAPARFYLKGPSDCVWGVDLVKKPDGLFFADGWEEFVFDHSLSTGDFLLFKHDGSSIISVMVFDNTACEKKDAFFARPTCDDKLALSFDMRVKRDEEKLVVGSNLAVKRKRNAADSYNDCSAVVTTRMWSMQRNAAQEMISGRLISFPRSYSDLFDKSLKCSRDLSLAPPHNQTKDKKNVSRGFLSQRRPTTQKERDDALAKAHSFNSEKPFFMMVMKGSYVYHGFYLAIPGSFPFKHLPCHTGKMYLHDPSKRRWAVNYIYSRRPALSGGWGKFSVGNNLETDDVVVFELVERSHMKVHIFRVVDDFKPLTRFSRIKKRA